MRILSAAVLSALVLAGSALPSAAQEDPDLPGVRVTITPRSYLDPGNRVPARSARYYAKSNLYGNTFLSSNYNGVIGFERYPLADPLDLPYSGGQYVIRAPDRIR
jgi:hypothetical protein